MKRKIIKSLVFVMIFSFLIGCSSTEKIKSKEQNSKTNNNNMTEETEMEKTTYILFIGNSYTYYNDMRTSLFKNIAESAGINVDVSAITKGGYRLSQHANPEDEYGKKVEEALTGDKKYDYVILQEQSLLPAYDNPPAFYDAVRNLSNRIKKNGATPILYSTWGRKSGHTALESNGWTNESMTWRLAASYQAIGDELDITVAHAGLAFYDVYTNNTDIELYNSDLTHPSCAGSFLAAATLFAKIFNFDVTQLNYTAGFSSDDAKIIYNAAKKAAFNTPIIPAEYKKISQNVTNNG